MSELPGPLDPEILKLIERVEQNMARAKQEALLIASKSFDRERLEKLFPSQGSLYFDNLAEICGEQGEDLAISAYERLIRDPAVVDQALVKELKEIETQSNINVPESILKAKDALDFVFNHSLATPAIRSFASAVVIYGSIQYCDPKNLDADVLVVDDAKARRQHISEDFVCGSLGDLLISAWKNRRIALTEHAEPHATLYVLEGEKPYDKEIASAGLDLAIIITGQPFWLRKGLTQAALQKRAIGISEADPLTCALVNSTMAECLVIRRERRAQTT